MKNELLKYKHYFVLLSALLLANYVLVPLSAWQETQLNTLKLLTKKYNKTQELFKGNDKISIKENELVEKMALYNSALFKTKDLATFKLRAQSKIEKFLTESNCKIERIGFKGNSILEHNIERWTLEIRYKGDALCVLNTTRTLESMQPKVRIDSYNVLHQGLKEDALGEFNANLNVSVWYQGGNK